MRILICGDIVGRSGRDAVAALLPRLKQEHKIDFAIVNVDNAAHGFGTTPDLCRQIYNAGADAVTLGNHGFDQREMLAHVDGDSKTIRAINYPPGCPGRGSQVFTLANGQKLLVIHALGRLFMDDMDCPFRALDQELAKHTLGQSVQAIVVDFHAEATSEKNSFGHHLDGRVSAVVGTHTHIPTADARILTGGTAFQTDIGMCGDFDSVIGFDKILPIQRFLRKLPTEKLQPASGPGTLCATLIETDDKTGLAKAITPLQIKN
ncbi:MAG: YmdB family metallophosphoesterase [Dongiaceae bacterium]